MFRLYYILCNDLLTREMTFLAFFLFADSGNTSHLTQYAHHDFTYYENYQPTSSNAGIYYLCNILSNNLFFKSSILQKSDSYFCIIIILQYSAVFSSFRLKKYATQSNFWINNRKCIAKTMDLAWNIPTSISKYVQGVFVN